MSAVSTGPASAASEMAFNAQATGRQLSWGQFWVGVVMMWNVERHPSLVRLVKPFFMQMTWRTSSELRKSLLTNAQRLLGPAATPTQQKSLAKRVLWNFYDFICDMGTTARMSDAEVLARIEGVEGRERYLQTRALRRGAILVTAHLGSFETAVAALRQDEQRVHVVFRRDSMPRFENLRAAQRRRLNVIEAPVDEGLGVWVRLRDALLNDEVVLMQGDRVMPGQSGERVPFLGGHMLLPTGPVKLAMVTGAPLVPVFAPRTDKGRVRILLEEPIFVSDAPAASRGHKEPIPALLQLASVIQRYIREYPDQWLMLHRALLEDQPDPT